MKNLTGEADLNVSPANMVDLRHDSPEAKLTGGDGTPELPDLDRALVEAAEEMSFDWPEFLPVERIGAGIAQMVLALVLFAGFLAFCYVLF